jgi:hypothetical protein
MNLAMKNFNIERYIFALFLLFFSFAVSAQDIGNLSYKKKELNSGVRFGANNEREELRTDESRSYEELTTGVATFQFENRFLRFADYIQEELNFNFEVGPLGGFGNWVDSTFVENRSADHKLFGIRTSAAVDYWNRFYYNQKNYTLIQITGWGRYDWFKQNSTGTSIDSNNVVTDFDESSTETKFRYGFEAKAGWGWGRLEPMNNYMLAEYILNKYYNGRNFSDTEIRRFAAEIASVKDKRNIKTGSKYEMESKAITAFLNEKMLLNAPGNIDNEWKMGEFAPRFNGSRIEGGPFFKYFNREPDFVYGGFIQYENAKYCNLKWNRNFSANVSYNGYKRDDWVLAEINIGWSYFPNLKREFDFGAKYVPGVVIRNSSNSADFNQGVIPYVGYFSQINAKARVNFSFAYRISSDKKMMLPGPEFSLSFYRSRY